jgi:hypothetical protein
MATEIKIWQISQGKLVPVQDVSFHKNYDETELESWIAQDPAILGEDLLTIDRQRRIKGVGQFDLLCIDSAGRLVVVELKRDSTPREAVAQALDYASWLNGATEDQIALYAAEYLGRSLSEAFTEHFQQDEMPELACQQHRIILVAPRLDAPAERIINYLATRYGIDINAVFFKYARLDSGDEVLVRSVLVAEEVIKERREHTAPSYPSWDAALAVLTNNALADFFRRHLATDINNNLKFLDLHFSIAGKRRFTVKLKPPKDCAAGIQRGRFNGDLDFWKNRLSSPDSVRPGAKIKGGDIVRFALSTNQDFSAFEKAVNQELQTASWTFAEPVEVLSTSTSGGSAA